MKHTIAAIFLSVSIVGCAATLGKNLERDSARAINPTPYPDSVKISNLQTGVAAATWTATTPSGVYDCSMERQERQPICAKRHPTP